MPAGGAAGLLPAEPVRRHGIYSRDGSHNVGPEIRMVGSLAGARPARGFRGIQFNVVISSNTRAVALRESFGFEVVGCLPGVSSSRPRCLWDAGW
jgi:hypothetical protein